MRHRGTSRDGNNFSPAVVAAVWAKGVVVPGVDPRESRLDRYGAWIHWSMYGNASNPENNGWEVDHTIPVARGGGDELSNLEPLQWENNRRKGDGPGNNFHPVTATR